jgi:hypothetical protein
MVVVFLVGDGEHRRYERSAPVLAGEIARFRALS